MSTTTGHPGCWNDKTLVLYNDLSTNLRNGKRYSDKTFSLLYRKEDGTSVGRRLYAGAWLIVDNGYLAWAPLIQPEKTPVSWPDWQFSKWLESMRKDVECTFGIMKTRFRILKTGIPLHGIEATDMVWLTCCALHNFLLEQDGFDSKWSCNQFVIDGQQNDSSGDKDDRFADRQTANLVVQDKVAEEVEPDDEPPVPLWMLTRNEFREHLVEHFDIQWQQRQIIWPSRDGLGQPPDLNFMMEDKVYIKYISSITILSLSLLLATITS